MPQYVDKEIEINNQLIIGKRKQFKEDDSLIDTHGIFFKDKDGKWCYNDYGSNKGSYRVCLNDYPGDYCKHELQPDDIIKFG